MTWVLFGGGLAYVLVMLLSLAASWADVPTAQESLWSVRWALVGFVVALALTIVALAVLDVVTGVLWLAAALGAGRVVRVAYRQWMKG